MKNSFVLFTCLCLASAYTECHRLLPKPHESRKQSNLLNENRVPSSVYIGPQDGLKEADRISALPGQPPSVRFKQYSGHVTVDPHAGRALFYYLAEAAENTAEKPLVLWLNGGPGCSSFGYGAMTELGPFRVKPDRKTLRYNKYAWNIVANVLFLESPAGVGFSYSKKTSDYVTGDTQTAADSYTFLLNWLERFPEYKSRNFFIAGESYAGHYIPQLADLILEYNKNTNNAVIKLKGIAMGNAFIDMEDFNTGMFDHWWTHALISDETHSEIFRHCDFYSKADFTKLCTKYMDAASQEIGNIDPYNIYGPLCTKNSTPPVISGTYDPCSENYTYTYLNRKEVQEALHATIAGHTVAFELCSDPINDNWGDMAWTVLPLVKKLMHGGIRVWIYSGDTDGVIPVTTTKYSLPKLTKKVETTWNPWYYKGEVGGYNVRYENLTFATVRGAGHTVPVTQPERALTLFTSFLNGKSLPRN